jgi:stage V sporulation protein S
MPRATLKAGTQTEPAALAGAIAEIIRKEECVDVVSIGAGALNQAIKAIVVARSFLITNGIDLVCRPAFKDLEIDGLERTSIKLMLDPQ